MNKMSAEEEIQQLREIVAKQSRTIGEFHTQIISAEIEVQKRDHIIKGLNQKIYESTQAETLENSGKDSD